MAYTLADETEKYRVAAVNPAKLAVLERLVAEHAEDQVLIIGQYLDQLHRVAERFGAPLLTGKTPTRKREQLYAAFRRGEGRAPGGSQGGHISLELPGAGVAIPISGPF